MDHVYSLRIDKFNKLKGASFLSQQYHTYPNGPSWNLYENVIFMKRDWILFTLTSLLQYLDMVWKFFYDWIYASVL